MSGTGRVPQSLGGQTRMNARPMTLSVGMVPALSPWCDRESADWLRWSPMTHNRPFGTVTSNGWSEGLAPGNR